MKKYLLISLFIFLSGALLAQEENKFDDYLSHYVETQLPYEIRLDSLWIIFPADIIPEAYILEYICEPGKPCDNNPYKYEYRYGVQFKLGDYVAVVISKSCDDYNSQGCTTEFGLGVATYIMIVYASNGEQISQSIIAQISFQHFAYGTFTKSDKPYEFLSFSAKQGTVHEILDNKNSIYKGVLDYNIYTIDQGGIISKKNFKSNNIRMKWGVRRPRILEEW